MTSKNEKIFKWFDQGLFKSAILGKGNYFIHDVTYKNHHDRLLIFQQLFLWFSDQKTDIDFTNIVNSCLNEIIKSENIHDVLDIIWCFILISDDQHFHLGKTFEDIQLSLTDQVKENGQEIAENIELRELVLSLSKKLPTFKKMLNI